MGIAWCDAAVSSPTGLWNHYESVHGVNMQVAPFTPPSAWQTLLGREMGVRTAHFASQEAVLAACCFMITFMMDLPT